MQITILVCFLAWEFSIIHFFVHDSVFAANYIQSWKFTWSFRQNYTLTSSLSTKKEIDTCLITWTPAPEDLAPHLILFSLCSGKWDLSLCTFDCLPLKFQIKWMSCSCFLIPSHLFSHWPVYQFFYYMPIIF